MRRINFALSFLSMYTLHTVETFIWILQSRLNTYVLIMIFVTTEYLIMMQNIIWLNTETLKKKVEQVSVNSFWTLKGVLY